MIATLGLASSASAAFYPALLMKRSSELTGYPWGASLGRVANAIALAFTRR